MYSLNVKRIDSELGKKTFARHTLDLEHLEIFIFLPVKMVIMFAVCTINQIFSTYKYKGYMYIYNPV